MKGPMEQQARALRQRSDQIQNMSLFERPAAIADLVAEFSEFMVAMAARVDGLRVYLDQEVGPNE